MQIDQDTANARATEHCRRGRAGQTSANDGNVGVLRHIALLESPIIAPKMPNKALALLFDILYPGKNNDLRDGRAGKGAPWDAQRLR
jgi:hypothetical protein